MKESSLNDLVQKRIKDYSLGDIIYGPNYSGQDDHDNYIVISILGPGERISGIDDERDHNRAASDPQDNSYGYMSLNLSGHIDEISNQFFHYPRTFKIWRDHANLIRISDNRIMTAQALVVLDKFSNEIKNNMISLGAILTREKYLSTCISETLHCI